MNLLAHVKKLFKQMVAWFRPDAAREPEDWGTAPLTSGEIAALQKTISGTPSPESQRDGPIGRGAFAAGNCSVDGVGVVMQPDDDERSQLNRHDRRKFDAMKRKYERERMKHDVWVKPNGPEPVKHERPATERKPQPPAPPPPADDFVDPNDRYCADEWVRGDGGPKVLFEWSEFFGTFNFRDTILDQLERYWIYLERMKRHDRSAYEFYKRMGATLVPYVATGTNWQQSGKRPQKISGKELEEYKSTIKLSPWFKQTWPTFGCIAYGTNPLDEKREREEWDGNLWCPKFLYFNRINVHRWPWFVQPVRRDGELYELTVWWDRPDHPKTKNKWGVPNDFPVWISHDGTQIRPLKTRQTASGRFRSQNDWRIPYAYAEWAKQYGLTAQLHLAHVFAKAAFEIETTHYATCRVEVTKGDLTAVFGIEPKRIPYFFRDRDITLDKHGRKERAFHSVRPYTKADGTAIPMTFRGLTDFEWAGYHVHISVPGRDHILLQEFNVPLAILKPHAQMRESDLDSAGTADFLRQKMKTGEGKYGA